MDTLLDLVKEKGIVKIIIDYKEEIEKNEYNELVDNHRIQNLINLNRIKYLVRFTHNRFIFNNYSFIMNTIKFDNRMIYDNRTSYEDKIDLSFHYLE